MSETDYYRMNTTALAYMGDAVYEEYVRACVIRENPAHVDELHRASVKFVRAEGQAKALRALMDGFLTEEETSLVKRARNHRATASKRTKASHGSDPVTDKLATAFEALIGYLYLAEKTERLKEIIAKSISIIETDNRMPEGNG